MKLKWIKKAAVLSIVATLALTGCSKKDSTTPAPSQEPETQQMVTITDAKGEVTIPANPERIVDISGNSDILSILGYSVIGTANSDAYDYTKFPSYLEETLRGAKILGYSMQDTMDVEAIIGLDPDLIIISNYQEKMYDQLSAIAPTVMIELAQTDWKEDVFTVAEIMGKVDKATQWMNEYEIKAEKVGAQMRETYGEDTSYLAMLASGGQIFLFDKAGVGSVFYEDMNLTRPDGMPQQESISLPVVTYEGLATIDADYLIAIGTEEDMVQLKNSPIYNSMEAVKNGNVIELPSSPYFNIGYSSIGRLAFLDQVLELMEK